jgi:two-component sensor histidine kinase
MIKELRGAFGTALRDPAAVLAPHPDIWRLWLPLMRGPGTVATAVSTRSQRFPISLQVLVNGGTAESAEAVSLGLIVTELVINALKHAFPIDTQDSRVVVSYEIDGADWKLVVSDNGIGKPDAAAIPAKGGLGTTLVKALAQDLDARVEVVSGPGGVNVSLTHAALTSRLPQ